ncbi:MAG: NAD(+) kinase [Gammaproteobacteria bacterium]|nr:NAD(+) kinase [Gammaproteobacteria bacterium]
MSTHFKTIALIARQNRPELTETLETLTTYLQSENYDLLVETHTAKLIPHLKLKTVAYEELGKDTDLIIVIGGDGSLLYAAKSALKYNTPIIGVNRGTLGFLTDINPEEAIEKIGEILAGKYQEERRLVLEAVIHDGHGKIVSQALALNDVVLLPSKDSARMIQFDVKINKEFVCSQRSDGLIVATPTGSTAYALSGGGPILSPEIDAITLVPMFPHTLTMRPIVVSANSKVKITISNNLETKPRVSCDGETPLVIPADGHIHINKSQYTLRLLHPQDYDYYHTLRTKLHWGTALC